MWVKVDEVVHFGNRRAIAVLTRQMVAEAGFPVAELWRVMRLPEFNEELIRKILQVGYGDISKWQVLIVSYRPEADSLDVIVSSPDFEAVEPGMLLPRLHSLAEKTDA
jgi:hypothetical protein